MEITGRVTADAVVNKVQSTGSEVVNFSIAINDRYKPKGSDEVKEITTYINCAYWLSTKTAAWVKKGAIVQVAGRIGMNVYNNSDGNAVGSLTFHVDNLKILAFAKKQDEVPAAAKAGVVQQSGQAAQDNDDLPF
ncbi:single-stranded DNA-binding protein [Flavobacterium sp. RHBU_24]|uniref:single-stranded DNA-binding protein n=1 Tax=Flavobacterium sp. RHBU_24 TaxID=3391185 RepID=UPI00398465CE